MSYVENPFGLKYACVTLLVASIFYYLFFDLNIIKDFYISFL